MYNPEHIEDLAEYIRFIKRQIMSSLIEVGGTQSVQKHSSNTITTTNPYLGSFSYNLGLYAKFNNLTTEEALDKAFAEFETLDAPDFIEKLKTSMDGIQEAMKQEKEENERDAAEYPNIALMSELSKLMIDALKIPKEALCKKVFGYILFRCTR